MNLKKHQKILAFVLSAAIVFTSATLSPAGLKVMASGSGGSSGELSVTLGAPTPSSSGSDYSYQSAAVTGSGIQTTMINFSESVLAGDKIDLPASPDGFTVSATSSGNNYTKRINIDTATVGTDNAAAVQDYLRGIGYQLDVGHTSQSIKVTISKDYVQSDTFYNIDTQHYYQYISGLKSWTDAYTTAMSMTYMGRTGYLATVISEEEDIFLNSLSGGKVGWLGGTILAQTSTNTEDASGGTAGSKLYYPGFSTSSFVTTGWYWADGPEIGTIFYNLNSINAESGTDANKATAADAYVQTVNPDTYYNWARTGGYEPNNTGGGASENCLTTLLISGRSGAHDTLFSWNDIAYNYPITSPTSDYSAKGYFVEYGDKLQGSDEAADPAKYASAGGTISSENYTITVTSRKTAALAARRAASHCNATIFHIL